MSHLVNTSVVCLCAAVCAAYTVCGETSPDDGIIWS